LAPDPMLPVIATRRLELRPLRPDDARPMQTYAADWDVARMLALVPHPYPEGEAEAFIEDMARAPDDEVPWHVFAIDLDGFIGTLGITSDNRFTADPVSIGYWIGKPFWGRGLMSEAVEGVLRDYVFGTLGMRVVTSGMYADNPASLRVQEKLGFVRVGEGMKYCLARRGDAPHIDTRLTRAAFERATA
jgi:RimJ/RimL family protein N-acetyltransferase